MVLKVEDPPHQARRKVYRDLNLQIIFGVTLMVVLGVSSIAPAFPKIAKALSLSHNEIELLVSVFTLPGIFLTPVFGFLADRFGRKRILIPSLFLFGLAGGLAFFCKGLHLLLLLRFIQGVGAASLGSINLTIIGDLYSGKDRIAAMGYNSSALSIGTASYPAIGGALAVLGWNYPFLLALLAIPVGLLVMFKLENPEPKNTQDIAAYFRDVLNIIKQRRVFGLFIAGMVTFIVVYGAFITYFPLLMESSFGSSAFTIGIFMSTFAVSNGITAYQLEKLSRRFSEQFLIKAGFILYVIVLLIIPFAPNIWIMLVPTLLSGVANGINIPSILSLLAESAPIKNRAVFMSINGMILRLGQTIGPLFIGLFYGLGGMEFAFLAASIFVLIMIGIVVSLIS